MKRHQEYNFFTRLPFILVFAVALSFSQVAKAERPTADNIYAWLVNMGGIAFDAAGGLYLPGNVLTGLRDGRFSDFSQLLLFTHQMSACVKKTIEKAPGKLTPYVTARDMFDDGLCRLTSCFSQSLGIAIMTETNRQLRAATGLTEAQRNEARQQIALAMYNSIKTKKCGNNGRGFDSAVFTILGGLTPSN
ncbi:MAG: hypothetical protein H6617_10030 [Bdellovibrionaceae bacterium]|nr:hypothetical protein [Bdellovibrionales bacterium]MCB9255008.1 hypothetical protein [Pseudobdellovibrionaceae bacterium]